MERLDAGAWIAWCLAGLPLFSGRFPTLREVEVTAGRVAMARLAALGPVQLHNGTRVIEVTDANDPATGRSTGLRRTSSRTTRRAPIERINNAALDKPEAARRWAQKLAGLAEHAAALPFAGRRVPEFDRDDIREVIKHGYRIMYRVSDKLVEIVAVMEGHRQVSADISTGDRALHL